MIPHHLPLGPLPRRHPCQPIKPKGREHISCNERGEVAEIVPSVIDTSLQRAIYKYVGVGYLTVFAIRIGRRIQQRPARCFPVRIQVVAAAQLVWGLNVQ